MESCRLKWSVTKLRRISVLLPKDKKMIDKYADANSEVVFDVWSSQRYNTYFQPSVKLKHRLKKGIKIQIK